MTAIFRALELLRKLGKGGEWELTPRGYFVIFAHIMALQGVWFCLTGPSLSGHHLFGITLFLVAALGGGAGGHRRWTRRSTDVGQYYFNLFTAFIDLMAKAGLAYDLKTVPDHVIRKRAARTGDGSHPYLNRGFDSLGKAEKFDGTLEKLDVGEIGPAPWGWGDSDLPQEDIQDTVVLNSRFID